MAIYSCFLDAIISVSVLEGMSELLSGIIYAANTVYA